MMRKNRGILTVVSGFSGSGKGTIMKELMKKYADSYALSISATTRNPRPGETDGVEYFFRTREQFEQMIEEDALIEYAQFVGNYYGTPKAYVEEQLEAGKDPGSTESQRKVPGYVTFVCDSAKRRRVKKSSGRQRNRDHGCN